jgi:hypothetical protein
MPPPRPPKPPPPRPPKPPPPPPAAGAYRGTTMLVHFRETPYGLAMSLVESRRENGKVRHDFVASLGSLETPPSVTARVEFWRGLHERLDQLSNRLDAETRGKVIGAVHSRVPMVTSDEQRALQLEAKGDAGQWATDFLSRRVGLAPQQILHTRNHLAPTSRASSCPLRSESDRSAALPRIDAMCRKRSCPFRPVALLM